MAARLIAWRRQALGAVNSQFAQPRMQRLVGSIARQVHLPQARVRRLMGAVARIWVREYADARIILERNADLQYFYVSGRLQQRLMRAAMVSSGALAILVALLAGNNIRLAVQTARLTDTRARLLDTFRRLGGQDVPIDDTQEHLWAGQIVSEAQARQARLQNLLDTSIGALSDQNGRLSQDLRRAGIDEQKLAEVTGSLPMGGADVAIAPAGDAASQTVSEQVARNHELKDVLRALPNHMPLADYTVSSEFGLRKHPLLGRIANHTGVDMYAPGSQDDTVYSVAGGTVKLAHYDAEYGNVVVLTHAGGMETLYGHMRDLLVAPGQQVKRGAVLGHMGSTGRSTGTHLHFEVLVGGQRLDPEKVVSAARNLQEAEN